MALSEINYNIIFERCLTRLVAIHCACRQQYAVLLNNFGIGNHIHISLANLVSVMMSP